MRLNITIVTNCDSLIVILIVLYFLSLKLENGLKKLVQNVTEIEYGFVKLVVTFLPLFVLISGFYKYEHLYT